MAFVAALFSTAFDQSRRIGLLLQARPPPESRPGIAAFSRKWPTSCASVSSGPGPSAWTVIFSGRPSSAFQNEPFAEPVRTSSTGIAGSTTSPVPWTFAIASSVRRRRSPSGVAGSVRASPTSLLGGRGAAAGGDVNGTTTGTGPGSGFGFAGRGARPGSVDAGGTMGLVDAAGSPPR
jgi:hypothetical protein